VKNNIKPLRTADIYFPCLLAVPAQTKITKS
jgi:hypothetical protein